MMRIDVCEFIFMYRVIYLVENVINGFSYPVLIYYYIFFKLYDSMISVVQRSEPRNSSHLQKSKRSRFWYGHSTVADKLRDRRITVRAVFSRSRIYQVITELNYVPSTELKSK